MKFQKRNAKLRWFAYFGSINNIRAFSQVPDDEHMYVCGDTNLKEDAGVNDNPIIAPYSAQIVRMKNDGSVRWHIRARGSNPNGGDGQDKCMGIAHNEETGNVAVLLQAKMSEVRQSNKYGVNENDNKYNNGFFDTILILLNQSGDVESAVSIT